MCAQLMVKFDFFAVWNIYMPSLIMTENMCISANVIEIFATIVRTINNHMKSQLLNESLTQEVMKSLSHNSYKKIDDFVDIFKILHNLSTIIHQCNRNYGLQIIIYIILTIIMTISTTYYHIIVFLQNHNKQTQSGNYFTEYWCVIFSIVLLFFLNSCQRLNNSCVETIFILHKFINKLPHLQDDVNLIFIS